MLRQLSVLFVVIALLAVGASARADVAAFDAKAFEQAQESGKGIVVHVHATW
jgi:hypothetical protein